MANGSDFTPVQRRMMAVLADGRPHTPRELHACLEDEMGEAVTVRVHLTSIRKVLRPRGQDISMSRLAGQTTYTLVRLLPSANDGRS